MEPNESHHHPHHHHLSSSSYFTTTPTPATTTPSPTNGLLQPAPHDTGGGGATHMVYPHSVGPSTAAVSSAPVEPPKRKRGRPRKYGTPEQALAAKKTASSSANSVAARERREAAAAASSPPSSSSRKSQQLVALGNTGQGFTSHVISVAAGEDVAQKIMMFMGQSSREMCILSASGSISNASLRQPATSGGSIAYEGRFEIISLSGSYVRTEFGGRTGGLSVCLSNTDGQIIGGGIGGPLTAGGPVQVIVGTFVLDNKKDVGSGVKVDASTSKLPSPVGGASIANIGFRSPAESSGRNPFRPNDDHQTIGGNPFMIPSRGMHDWGSGTEARANATFDLTGRTSHGARQSPENGDYEQYPD